MTPSHPDANQREPSVSPAPQRKPYLPPRLETCGTVRDLTAGPFGGNEDVFAGGTGGFQTFSP